MTDEGTNLSGTSGTLALREGISDFHTWWKGELRGLLPAGVRGERDVSVAAIVTIRRDGFLIAPANPSSKAEPISARDAVETVEILRKKYFRMRIARPAVTIVIGEGRYLERQLSHLRLPRSRLGAMARLDVSASTPFSLQDAYVLCARYDEHNRTSRYAVVKKSIIKPLLDALSRAGIRVGSLVLEGSDGTFSPDAASMAQLVPVSRWRVMSARLQRTAAALLVAGIAATVAHAHWRYHEAGNELDQSIAEARDQATMVRALVAARNLKLSQVTAIRNEKRGAVPLVSVLEEMSRIIPDSTWLTDVEIDGDEVVFSGFSRSAAALIPVLEESKLFRNPTFRSPVVRVANQSGERFTIAMDVEAVDG